MAEVGDPSGSNRPVGGWPHGLLRGAGGPSLVARLERWVADARVDEAALRRSRERWLLEVASQEATLMGTLLDLGERQATVAVRTTAGRVHQGAVEAVGVDFVGIRRATGSSVLLARRALAVVRTSPGEPPTMGDRALASDLRMADLVRELAADRERVLVVTVGGEALSGELRAGGEDLLTLRTEADPPTMAHVPLEAVSELVLG